MPVSAARIRQLFLLSPCQTSRRFHVPLAKPAAPALNLTPNNSLTRQKTFGSLSTHKTHGQHFRNLSSSRNQRRVQSNADMTEDWTPPMDDGPPEKGQTLGQTAGGLRSEPLVTLETNIDDMSPQVLAYVMERLLAAGALDTWILQAIMKKGRPGMVLNVLCSPADVDTLSTLIFRETSTLGIRILGCQRISLERKIEQAPTPWGFVAIKTAYLGSSLVTAHAEYEDCAKAARRHGVPLKAVFDAAHQNYLDLRGRERPGMEER